MVQRKVPLDLEEEILVRVPPLSLLRFRSVCKEWNTLIDNKRFVNKNFACGRPEFMLKTHSTIYSVRVNLNDDPTIKVSDLCFKLGGNYYNHNGNCDGYFYKDDFDKGGVVWNPVLRHIKWISPVGGSDCRCVGYDGSRPEKSYKIIGTMDIDFNNFSARITNNAWLETDDHTTKIYEGSTIDERDFSNVSLNGNLYWTAYKYPQTGQYFIQILDFSKEIIKNFCILPCKGKSSSHTRALAIYKGDRFSVLEQCKRTRKIEIWVTKNKIDNGDDGDRVVWIKFMTVSVPNFPSVCHNFPSYLVDKSVSYFVDSNIHGKCFILCCSNKNPKEAWVYIVRGDLCKKIKIDEVVCQFQSSVYVPSLITIS